MANTKISQLPTWTGTSADSRFFVMNNSDETETFKFSGFTAQIKPGIGTDSVVSIYFNATGNTSPNGVLIGGLNTNRISSTGNYNAIIGGFGSTITLGESNGIYCSKDSTISGSKQSIILGGRNNNCNNEFALIAGGGQNTAGYLSATIAGFNLNASSITTIVGGENQTSSSSYGGIFGGTLNVTSGNYNAIYNSLSTTISSSGQRNTIIASNNSTITGTTAQAVMVGTSGRTATTDYATFVENLVIFNYAALDFVDDAAADAGGVVLGQVYHNAGALRIRVI